MVNLSTVQHRGSSFPVFYSQSSLLTVYFKKIGYNKHAFKKIIIVRFRGLLSGVWLR